MRGPNSRFRIDAASRTPAAPTRDRHWKAPECRCGRRRARSTPWCEPDLRTRSVPPAGGRSRGTSRRRGTRRTHSRFEVLSVVAQGSTSSTAVSATEAAGASFGAVAALGITGRDQGGARTYDCWLQDRPDSIKSADRDRRVHGTQLHCLQVICMPVERIQRWPTQRHLFPPPPRRATRARRRPGKPSLRRRRAPSRSGGRGSRRRTPSSRTTDG